MAAIEYLLTRWMAPAALAGGALWVARAVWLALLPAGCTGAACSQTGHTARDSGMLTPLLVLAAALMALSVLGMVAQGFRAGRMGRLGRSGVIAIAMAGVELAVYGLTGIAPLAAMSGPLLILGIILTGAALLRAGALHKSAVMALLVGSVAMLGYDAQTSQALLAVPFGVAWLVVGLTLLLREEPATAATTDAPA